MEKVDELLAQLVRDGFLNIHDDGVNEPRYSLTPAGTARAEHVIATDPDIADFYTRLFAADRNVTPVKQPRGKH